MTINATASILLAFYLVCAEERGISPSALSGTVQNDILKEHIARGTYIFSMAHGMRLGIDLLEFSVGAVPQFNPISISGYHIREAGSNAAQEVAFTFANAIAYLNQALLRGIDVDSIAPKLSFFFAVQSNFFEEIAKFRAARRVWAKLLSTRFNAKEEKSLKLRFHAQTAGSTLSAHQVQNNIPRVAFQALAAVLGGAQSIHTNAYDEALSLPSQDSAILALRTQQIIAHEIDLMQYADPLGGSEVVETITDRLEQDVLKILDDIEKQGGMLSAISAGHPQSILETSAYNDFCAVQSVQRVIVGENKWKEQQKPTIAPFKIDLTVEKSRAERITSYRLNRNNSKYMQALENLEQTVVKNENLMPAIIDCARKRATLGEIVSSIEKGFQLKNPKNNSC